MVAVGVPNWFKTALATRVIYLCVVECSNLFKNKLRRDSPRALDICFGFIIESKYIDVSKDQHSDTS